MDASRTVRLENPPGEWITPGRFALGLVVLLFIAFPLVLLGREAFYFRDYGVLGYPFVFHSHQSFWRGEFPLWNPFSNCGTPFLAQWGTLALYPPSLFYLILPLPWSLGVFCLGHLWLGGMGMFLLARRWVASPFAASVAGVAFVFSGTMFSCLLWPNYTVALGWMPWLVLLSERSWREGGRVLVLAGLAGGMQMLAGVPEVVALTCLLLACLWLGEIWRGEVPRLALARRAAVVALIVTGLTAVQLLPFLDLLEHSQRDQNFATSKWAMPGWGLANLLVPLFHCFQTFQGPALQGGQEFFSSYYPGAGVLVLAVAACWRARERRVWILAGLVLFSFLMAWGENGFLYPLAKQAFHWLGVARYPIKFVLLAAFALPLLAAVALRRVEAGTEELSTRRQTILMIAALALLGMAAIVWWGRMHPYSSSLWSTADNARAAQLEWTAVWPNALGRAACLCALLGMVLVLPRVQRSRWRAAAQLGLLGLLVTDVLTHAPKQNPTLPVSAFAPGLGETENQWPLPKWGEGRVLISPSAEQRLLYGDSTNALHDFVGKRLALWSNLNLLDEVPKVNGSSTLQLREQAEVQRLLYGGTNRVGPGLLDFLAVSRFSAARNPTEWLVRTNACSMLTCGQQPVFVGETEVLPRLAADDFNPREVVYLSAEARAHVTVQGPTEAQVFDARFSTRALEFEVEAKTASLVVIAQSFYHPWQARVNGQATRILRANHAFQALEVPAGRHRVSLVYYDYRFVLGGAMSMVTVLGCAIFWLQSRGNRGAGKTPALFVRAGLGSPGLREGGSKAPVSY